MAFVNLPGLSPNLSKYKHLSKKLSLKIKSDQSNLEILEKKLTDYKPAKRNNFEYKEITLDTTDPSFFISNDILKTKGDQNLLLFLNSSTTSFLGDPVDEWNHKFALLKSKLHIDNHEYWQLDAANTLWSIHNNNSLPPRTDSKYWNPLGSYSHFKRTSGPDLGLLTYMAMPCSSLENNSYMLRRLDNIHNPKSNVRDQDNWLKVVENDTLYARCLNLKNSINHMFRTLLGHCKERERTYKDIYIFVNPHINSDDTSMEIIPKLLFYLIDEYVKTGLDLKLITCKLNIILIKEVISTDKALIPSQHIMKEINEWVN